MNDTLSPIYTFTSKAVSPDTFKVVRFHGNEGLSQLYNFTVTLISRESDLDLTTLVQNPACLTILFPQGDIPFNGILSSFEIRQQFTGVTFYQATLRPKVWWLTLTEHNQIFLDTSLPDFLTSVLVDGGLKAGTDFELRLEKSYPQREYVSQYGETHFNFVSRWMERNGLYYFFEQHDHGEKMIITDHASTHAAMSQGSNLRYRPISGLDWPVAHESIKRFNLTQTPVPATVKLKEYNYRQPDQDLSAQTQVADYGRGETYMYGDHFSTASEGQTLAKIRSEEILCREKIFHGLSTVPYLRTGYTFTLDGHFRDEFNTTYLTITARHEGGQESYLSTGLGLPIQASVDHPVYRNTFEVIPSTTQFRPARTALKPYFHGVMNAWVDASSSGKYAELDDQGRYKIRLPYDVSDRPDGEASAYVRMLQPYGGSGHGLHFPLHKDTEVIVTYVDGDPDRPVIQACVPNPDTPSQVTESSKTKCKLTTSGGNTLHIENSQGNERILMQSPTANSYMRIGQPNDPPASIEDAPDQAGWKINTDGPFKIRAGLCNSMIIGDSESWVIGNAHTAVVGDLNTWHGLHNKSGFIGKQETNLVTFIAGLWSQHALGSKVCTNASNVKIAGQATKMKAAKTELEDAHESLEGQRNALVTAKQNIEQTQANLQGDIQRLRTLQTSMQQTVSNLNGQNTQLVQAKQTLTTSTTKLSLQKSTLTQQKTELKASKTMLQTNITDTDALRDDVNTMKSRMTANRTIL